MTKIATLAGTYSLKASLQEQSCDLFPTWWPEGPGGLHELFRDDSLCGPCCYLQSCHHLQHVFQRLKDILLGKIY